MSSCRTKYCKIRILPKQYIIHASHYHNDFSTSWSSSFSTSFFNILCIPIGINCINWMGMDAFVIVLLTILVNGRLFQIVGLLCQSIHSIFIPYHHSREWSRSLEFINCKSFLIIFCSCNVLFIQLDFKIVYIAFAPKQQYMVILHGKHDQDNILCITYKE